MHDLRWIREHPEEFDRGLRRRGLPPGAEQILALDRSWRAAETRAQEAQARRNRLAREIGVAVAASQDRGGRGAAIGANVEVGSLGPQPALRQRAEELKAEAAKVGEDVRLAEADATRLRAEIDETLAE